MAEVTVKAGTRGKILSRLDYPVYLSVKIPNNEKNPTDSIVIPPRGKVAIDDVTLLVNSDKLPSGLTLVKDSN